MIESEVELLNRAHQMFVGSTRHPRLNPGTAHHHDLLQRAARLNSDATQGHYQLAVDRHRQVLLSAARTDSAADVVIAGAHQDRARAGELTKSVLDQARADAAVTPVTPMAQRDAMRRRAARLRAQRMHVLSAHSSAHRRLVALRALRYRMLHDQGRASARLRLPPANSRAGIAVRAALSRLGRPYVWGATGPDQFDCSGLVQWSYAHAGFTWTAPRISKSTRGSRCHARQVRPGDLVFPHAGHVQMAIGDNLVVEAPYSGAAVRISPLGNNIAIRRPE